MFIIKKLPKNTIKKIDNEIDAEENIDFDDTVEEVINDDIDLEKE